MDSHTISCVRSTLLHEDAIKLSTAKVYVFSDSVLCLGGRIAEYPQSVKKLGRTESNGLHNLLFIVSWTLNGEPIVFEWTIFPTAHHAEATPKRPKHDGER